MSNTQIMNSYENQIKLFNNNNFNKIQNGTILIIGLNNHLIVEISKKLVLNNIKNLFILKDEIDYSIYLDQLYKLNTNTSIIIVDDIKQNQDITIIINQTPENIEKYTSILNSKLIILFFKNIHGIFLLKSNLREIAIVFSH